jgi:3-mercaptopyruvate sulfurtransferase SseA
VSTEAPAFAAARFDVRPGTVGVATMDDVKAAINRPGVKLVDARTQAEIEGRDLRGIRRGGHIESSVAV